MYCLLDCAAHWLLHLAHLVPLGFSSLMAFVVLLIVLRPTFLCQELAAFALSPAAANTLCPVKAFLVPLEVQFSTDLLAY